MAHVVNESRMPCSRDLWTLLPSEVVDLILAHLSFADVARVQLVCREWRSCVHTPWFRKLQDQVRTGCTPPTLLLYNYNIKVCYTNTLGCRWVETALPTPSVREWVGHPLSRLICVHTGSDMAYFRPPHQFMVGSPFSKEWVPIPDPPDNYPLSKLWAIVTPPDYSPCTRPRYWVLVLVQLHIPGPGARSLCLNIFDSEAGQWHLMPVPETSTGGHLLSFSSTAECMCELIYSINPESRNIITFDVRNGRWGLIPAELPEDLVFCTMADRHRSLEAPPRLLQGWNGRVLLVGATTKCPPSSPDTIAGGSDAGPYNGRVTVGVVWELEPKRLDCWREVARCPFEMNKGLVDDAWEWRRSTPVVAVRYCGHGDLVVVMAVGSPRAMQFHVMHEKWEWLDLPNAVNCNLGLCFSSS